MVSGEICIWGLSECSRFSQAEICRGDHSSLRRASTSARSLGESASLVGLGRRRRRIAARSASAARYRFRPPFRATSRETEDGARPILWAKARHESPTASPRDSSSRSAAVSSRRERCGVRGRTPPAATTWACTASRLRPMCLAITQTGSPAARRVQTSAFSAPVNRNSRDICTSRFEEQ